MPVLLEVNRRWQIATYFARSLKSALFSLPTITASSHSFIHLSYSPCSKYTAVTEWKTLILDNYETTTWTRTLFMKHVFDSPTFSQ